MEGLGRLFLGLLRLWLDLRGGEKRPTNVRNL